MRKVMFGLRVEKEDPAEWFLYNHDGTRFGFPGFLGFPVVSKTIFTLD